MTFSVSLPLIFILACCACNREDLPPPSFKIAFGSCGYQDHPLPIFNEIVKADPDLFVFLGDNIYGDTYEMDTLRAKYDRLAAKSSFQNLQQNVPIVATWDDHDYGWNDAGRHYPYREEAKQIFMDFFAIADTAAMRKRAGIYASHYYQVGELIVQLLLLDTRTFRDNLLQNTGEFKEDRRYFYPLDYTPHTTADSTLLGESQWMWLEKELRQEADVRIVASSTQFGIEYNGYEAWANFPHEQQRFLNLIKEVRAAGVLFISGDVHYAEISRLDTEGLYPIYDVTSSGLSSTWYFATPNKNRIEGPVMENHFGLITILSKDEPLIQAEIWDISGNQRIEHTILLSELQF